MSRWGWLALVVMLASMAAPLVPAAANHEPPAESHDAGGSGSLEGRELVEDQAGFPCFRVTRHLFGLRGAGTYEGRTATGGPVVFRGQIGAGETLYANGPLQVQIENTEPYYHSPFGTHGTEAGGGAGCSPSTVGDPIPAEFRVFAAEGTQDSDGDKKVDVLTDAAWVYRLDGTGAKVPCVAHGSYARGTKGNPAFGDTAEVMEWTLDEDCVVVGNAAGTPGTGKAPRGTYHTFHGTHEPCFGDVMAGDCPRNIRHDYSQFLPKPGPFLTLTGPGSEVIGCGRPVTVNARLTVDGLAQANVAVTFSVAGPAPAAPPAGAGTTGADGRAAFTFGAAAPGDYTVTAKATYGGQERVATHTVRFDQLPPLSVTLAGPTKGQTEESTTVRATVRNACGTLSGATVNFSVAWPSQNLPWTGQATPSSGSATTDGLGEASFSFSGNRAGNYRVTATTSVATEQASATHTADLAINTLKRVGSLPVSGVGEGSPKLSVMDPAGTYAYFATGPNYWPTKMVKLDLTTFQRVSELPLPESITSLVIDPGGDYAYAGTFEKVLKLDLNTFQLADTLVLPDRPTGQRAALSLYPAAAIDPAGRYAYFGNRGSYSPYASDPSTNYPAQVLKIDLNTFQQVGALDTELGVEDEMMGALMDPSGAFGYFNFYGDLGGRVVKVDLSTFQRVGAAPLSGSEEAEPGSAVIDPAGDFAYIGTTFSNPGRVVKVDLRTMTRVGAITLNVDRTVFGPYPVDRNEYDLYTALMDPAGRYAYFGTKGTIGSEHPAAPDVPARLIRIDLASFTRAESVDLPSDTENLSVTAVIDPTGTHAYLGAAKADASQNPYEQLPGLVVKVRLNRPPSPALSADADVYATDYETPLTVPAPGVLANDRDTVDADPLVAGQAGDPAGGSVVLNADGSFTYTPDARFAGPDTFTYTASDGMGYSAPATVSIEVAPPVGLQAISYNYYTNVSLFGGPYSLRGYGQAATASATASSPSAACPEGVGTTSVTDPDGAKAQYGPAVIFGGIWPDSLSQAPPSGPLTSSVDCRPGAAGYVSTSTKAALMPGGSAYPGGVGPGPFIADEVHTTCLARADGTYRVSTRIQNGILETRYDPQTQLAVQSEPVPANPPANYTREGTIDHVGDSYRIVFNEQIHHPDRTTTVNAAHMYLLGPTAVGDMVVGSSTCGPGTLPLVGATVADFDGDSDTDRSVFRNGAWYAEGQTTAYLGQTGDIAVPGDYDGDRDA
ncbi:MAG TPA: cadherin-like domain-containing protein, partial [Acidimicrobiales bacterium]|nr:cadherin-like domain-containing protein [Acidimicrobiales bacterium]